LVIEHWPANRSGRHTLWNTTAQKNERRLKRVLFDSSHQEPKTTTPVAKATASGETTAPKNHAYKFERTPEFYETMNEVLLALIELIDITQISKLDLEAAREEIRDIVGDIMSIKQYVMSIAEQEALLSDICNDLLGYGPLEPLLARDDIADIMVNGAGKTFIEVGGKMLESDIRFRDNAQLLSICQRIVSQVGRRVDESSPICDARLPDGSRVNIITSPLAIDGTALTIRKFKKDKLTLDQLVKFGSITPEAAVLLQIIGRIRCNLVISGGTGSGKTTLLNCMTAYIDKDERVITCETRPNFSCNSRMSCALKHARQTLKAKAKSPCVIS